MKRLKMLTLFGASVLVLAACGDGSDQTDDVDEEEEVEETEEIESDEDVDEEEVDEEEVDEETADIDEQAENLDEADDEDILEDFNQTISDEEAEYQYIMGPEDLDVEDLQGRILEVGQHDTAENVMYPLTFKFNDDETLEIGRLEGTYSKLSDNEIELIIEDEELGNKLRTVLYHFTFDEAIDDILYFEVINLPGNELNDLSGEWQSLDELFESHNRIVLRDAPSTTPVNE